jgi:hypothetical protein
MVPRTLERVSLPILMQEAPAVRVPEANDAERRG